MVKSSNVHHGVHVHSLVTGTKIPQVCFAVQLKKKKKKVKKVDFILCVFTTAKNFLMEEDS